MLLSLTAFAQQQDSSQTNVEHLIEEDTPSLSLDSIVEQHVVYDPNTDTYTIEPVSYTHLTLPTSPKV